MREQWLEAPAGYWRIWAGYNVNIGLAIASGAAAGGIMGGAGAQWGQWRALGAAPAAGALGAAISGADPGMGAAIAAATAAFAIGVNYGYQAYQRSALAQGPKANQASLDVDQKSVNSNKSIAGKCVSDYCEGLAGSFTKSAGDSGGRLDFGIQKTFPVGRRPLEVDLYWHGKDSGVIPWESPVSKGHQLLRSFSLTTHNMEHVTVPYGDGYYKLFVRPWGVTPSDHMGGGTFRFCVSGSCN